MKFFRSEQRPSPAHPGGDERFFFRKASRFVGTWQGLTVPGQIVIRANGTYTFGGAEGGRYRVSGNDIYFGGELLRAWNHGHATLSSQGNLEFYWTNSDGSKNYFAFGK